MLATSRDAEHWDRLPNAGRFDSLSSVASPPPIRGELVARAVAQLYEPDSSDRPMLLLEGLAGSGRSWMLDQLTEVHTSARRLVVVAGAQSGVGLLRVVEQLARAVAPIRPRIAVPELGAIARRLRNVPRMGDADVAVMLDNVRDLAAALTRIVDAVGAETRSRPLIGATIAIDDIHRLTVDEQTVLCAAIAHSRALGSDIQLIGTSLPRFGARGASCRIQTLHLPALDGTELDSFIYRVANETRPITIEHAAMSLLAVRATGYPAIARVYIRELIRQIKSDGVTRRSVELLGPHGRGAVIDQFLAPRTARLEPDMRRLLSAVASYGDGPVERSMVARTMGFARPFGSEPTEFALLVDALCRRELLHLTSPECIELSVPLLGANLHQLRD